MGGEPDDAADQPEVLTDTGVPADGCDPSTGAADYSITTNADEAEAADSEDQQPAVQDYTIWIIFDFVGLFFDFL